jgi:hypothetical protein
MRDAMAVLPQYATVRLIDLLGMTANHSEPDGLAAALDGSYSDVASFGHESTNVIDVHETTKPFVDVTFSGIGASWAEGRRP